MRIKHSLSKGARMHTCTRRKIKIPKHSDMMSLIESEWEEWQEGAFSRAAALKERHSANEINVFRLWWGRRVLIHSDTIQHVDIHVYSAGWHKGGVCIEELLSVSKRHRRRERERGRWGTGKVIKEFTWTGPMLLFLPPGMPSSLIARTHDAITQSLETRSKSSW